jgi:hypothetical protein
MKDVTQKDHRDLSKLKSLDRMNKIYRMSRQVGSVATDLAHSLRGQTVAFPVTTPLPGFLNIRLV